MYTYNPHLDFSSRHIVVVGLGGTGAQAARGIARVLYAMKLNGIRIPRLVLIDPDTVEDKNIGRQLFTHGDKGKNKATVVMQRLNAAYGLACYAVPKPVAVLMVFQDHYSYRPPKRGKRKNNLVIGPGYKLALIIPNAQDPRHGRPQAIFAWRLERYRRDRDYGANCAFFRNESCLPASDLILAAEEHAQLRWPYIPRFFTYIDTTMVKPTWRRSQPVWGYGYVKSGWTVLPQRTAGGLLRLEKAFMPLGWLGAWSTGTTVTTTAWPFPVRHCRQRDPRAGAQPPWRPYRRQARRAKTKPNADLQLRMFL